MSSNGRHRHKNKSSSIDHSKISANAQRLASELNISNVIVLEDLETNLNNTESYELILKNYEDETPRLFVLDNLQNIPDPRMLLRKLRALLKRHSSSRLIVATKGHNKTPHLKQSLDVFFEHAGFVVQKKDFPDLIVVSADEQSHQESLKRSGLPKPKPTIIITTEHASQSYSGGIGAYIEQVEAIMGSTSPIILYCGTKTFDYSLYKSGNVVDISKVSNVKKFNQLNVSQQSQTVYQATLELLFHYDQVTNIEYQDFRGVSAGIAQAKLAGELPPTVHLIVRCHASVSSIVFATHQQLNTAGLEVAKLEKLSVQYADIVLFPTQYLHDMYSQLGYSLVKPKKEVAIRRLPYQYTTQPGVKYSTITNIAFFGRRDPLKGYDDFCNMIVNIVNPESPYYLPQIKSVCAFGAGGSSAQLDVEFTEFLKSRGIKFDIRALNHADAMSTLDELASHTLFCLPYKADNHPMALIEMINHGCDFIAYNRGGIPELIPKNSHEYFLCNPGWQTLTQQIHERIKIPIKQRSQVINNLYEQATAEQQKINLANIL